MSGAARLARAAPQTSLLLLGAAGAWIAVVVVARAMRPMPGTMGLGFGSFVAVWALMMAAMMLPSVVPFASLYVRSFRERAGLRITGFSAGYLLVWTAAALPAYGLGRLADAVAARNGIAATAFAAAAFGACGVYQLTPVKLRCLARCRSPIASVLHYGCYRGWSRDLRAGLSHGLYCLGCCWGLMGLLVAVGMMNVVAMVGIAAAVLVEKAWSRGPWFGRVAGVCALGLAVAVVFDSGLAPGLHGGGSTGHMVGLAGVLGAR